MATAKIILQQNGDGYSTPASRDDLVLSLPVTMLNQDNTGIVSWAWIMVDRPNGSSATIASPTASTTTFTPDVVGTYLIHLSVNAGAATDQRGAAVKTANLHYRIPAATETIEFDGYRGWATATNFALKTLDDGYTPSITPSFQMVYNASSPSSFFVSTTNGGLQIHDASSPTGINLFEVDAYGGTPKYLSVAAASVSVGSNLLVTGSNFIGVNTPTPLYPVHVTTAADNYSFIQTRSTISGGLYARTASTAGFGLGTISNHPLLFFTNNTPAAPGMILAATGAVGIGVISPTAQLDVAGTGHFTGTVSLDAELVLDGYIIDLSGGALTNQVLQYNGTSFVAAAAGGAVSSVSNSDSSLTISPTTGSVVVSLNLAHSNSWSVPQLFTTIASDISPTTDDAYSLGNSTHHWKDGYFGGKIVLDGYNLDLSGGATNGQALIYNGTSFIATTPTGAVSSVSNSDSTLTISPTTGAVIASLNLAHANTWTAQQTIELDTVGTGQTVIGATIVNTTAATNNTQKYSPILELVGDGYGTTAGTSQVVKMGLQTRPVQATTVAGDLVFWSSLNGGAYTEVAAIKYNPVTTVNEFASTQHIWGFRNTDGTGVLAQTGTLFSYVNGSAAFQTTATDFSPDNDNGKTCGIPSQRWSTVYTEAITATNSTALTVGGTNVNNVYQGGQVANVTKNSTDVTVIDGYYIIDITDTSSPRTVTLQDSTATGRIIIVKDGSGAANITNTITVKGTTTNVDGVAGGIVINTNYGRIAVVFDGSNWLTL